MKRLGIVRDWTAFVLTVFGAIMLGDAGAKWLGLFGWASNQIREPLITVLTASISVIWAGCVLWVAFILLRLTLGLAVRGLRELPYLTLRLRGVLGMAQWITRREAETLIERSDFFAVRRRTPDLERSGLSALLARQMAYSAGPPRDTILERRFLKRLMATFEDRTPDAIDDGKVDAEKLQQWLDALIDREVDDEMGNIPSV